MELLTADTLPKWFFYPEDFLEFVKSGILNIGPWQILEGQWLKIRFDGLRRRYPNRELIPFARRLDNDDVACWDRINQEYISIVHDFSAPGWEVRDGYNSFQDWQLTAQEEAKEYDD